MISNIELLNKVACVAYGKDSDGTWYVQTACSGEHDGNKCACKVLKNGLTREKAVKFAEKKAKELGVDVSPWSK